MRRALAKHPSIEGEGIIPYAIEENIWQSVEDLFVNSPATRALVRSGKVQVRGALYDVGTGRVNWLPASEVDRILEKAEASPSPVKAIKAHSR